MAGSGERLAVQLDQRREPPRLPADDGVVHRQAQGAGPHGGGGRAAGGHTDAQVLAQARLVGGPRPDLPVHQGRAEPARPGHRVAGVEGEQQVELLLVQLVVVLEVRAEQRERLDEGAAAGEQLDAAPGELVHRGELLVDPHRVLGGEHGDGGADVDALGLGQRRRDERRRRGDGVVGPVVLPHARVAGEAEGREPGGHDRQEEGGAEGYLPGAEELAEVRRRHLLELGEGLDRHLLQPRRPLLRQAALRDPGVEDERAGSRTGGHVSQLEWQPHGNLRGELGGSAASR